MNDLDLLALREIAVGPTWNVKEVDDLDGPAGPPDALVMSLRLVDGEKAEFEVNVLMYPEMVGPVVQLLVDGLRSMPLGNEEMVTLKVMGRDD